MAVWIPEFDKCLLEKLQTLTIDGNPVHVTYSLPEMEGLDDEEFLYPSVALYMYDTIHDIEREQSIQLIPSSKTQTDVTLSQMPAPVKLCYQFTLTNQYVQHHNDMITQFLRLFPFRGFITVIDPESGEEQAYDFFYKSQSVRNSKHNPPYGEGKKERIFRTEYRYHLACELPQGQGETYKVVTEGVYPTINNTND